ncbi:methyl-accepting chemotaxis protein [Larsenimonas suaedae]|uniref:Nitrate- and nitrite sensing domain-containing protein n=1 Tax=Larsenimonas suaedae TaxID=1851019 RepID=A0ABU1GYQ4_9GAMM|nr:methyl-accepting chemotaxis protein [Larsenimonas suaedae]MCM2973690.1 nitrate- and nitrite sensing domain-containing protein [Larsenimonas suaedae]MDR5897176.1 nitrate- and nitrite sensing domain-containing protein [Larsenimonas suaedae]
MNHLLHRISMGRKFLLTLTLPLLAMVYFAVTGVIERQQTAAEMNQLQSLTALAQRSGDLVHQLQRERGMTAGFLGSNGQSFSDKLPEQRQATDLEARAFQEHVNAIDPALLNQGMKALTESIRQQLGAMAPLRRQVSALSVSTPEAISSYTRLNGDLMGLVGEMGHLAPQASVSMRLAAYYNLLQAKDLSGIERALLSNAFGADQISPALFQRFLGLIGKESAFLESFRALASTPMKTRLTEALSGPQIERLDALRELVKTRAATGGFGVDPEQWFDWQTVKLQRLKTVETAMAEEVLTTAEVLYRDARNDLIVYALIALIAGSLAIALAVMIVRSIVVPLRRALSTIRLRGNDLTQHLEVPGRDELSQLYSAFNESTANTERLVASTMQGSAFVKAASGEIAQGNQNLAQRTEEQSASLEQTAASMEQITATVNQTTDNAREVQSVSDEVSHQAQDASDVARQARAAMAQIHEANQQVTSIISTIDNIAFQTNLLALNASVEASRAGEHGRGFAVVAAEVRNLASRSAEEADNIRKLIDTNVARVDKGNSLVTQTSETLDVIAQRVKQVSSLISEITSATVEQSQGIHQINQAMTQLDEVTQHNAALVEEIAAASKALDEQSEEMEHTIGGFTVSDSVKQAAAAQQEDQLTARHNRPSSRARTLEPVE